MSTVTPSQSNAGETIEAADINNPINQLAAVINGGIDNTNIAAAAGIAGSKLADASVTPSKLATGAQATYVATSETTASTSYVALATASSVTVTIGSNGLALVSLFFAGASATATANQHMGFDISGASTVAATDEFSNQIRQVDANAAGFERQSAVFLVTGLTAGSTTFTTKFRVNTGTGTFKERRIAVVPL